MSGDLPAEGWYDDPDEAGGLRWWTGQAWSEHRRPPEGSVTDASVPAAATPEPEPVPEPDPEPVPGPEPSPFRPPGDAPGHVAEPTSASSAPTVPPPPGPAVPPPPPPAPLHPVSSGGGWQQPTTWQPRSTPPPPAPAPVSGRAASSLIVGLLWLFGIGSLVAIPLGILGRRDVARSEQPLEGRGMATAGIVVGVFGLLLAAWMLGFLLTR